MPLRDKATTTPQEFKISPEGEAILFSLPMISFVLLKSSDPNRIHLQRLLHCQIQEKNFNP
jgi:hypothetical protein